MAVISGNFAVVWSGSWEQRRHAKMAVAVKKRKGKILLIFFQHQFPSVSVQLCWIKMPWHKEPY